MPTKALIIIDLQFCFLPKGALATTDASDPDASKLLVGIQEQITIGGYNAIYISQDTHTKGHASFADSENAPLSLKKNFYSLTKRKWNTSTDQVVWTPHCVCDKNGGAVDGSDYNEDGKLGCDLPITLSALVPVGTDVGFVAKGFDHDVDSYSAIADAKGEPTPVLTRMNNKNQMVTFLDHLNERRYDVIDICGIARDKCVLWTAIDLLEYLAYDPKINFLYNLTRPVVAGLYDPELDITPKGIYEKIASFFPPEKASTFNVIRGQVGGNPDLVVGKYYSIKHRKGLLKTKIGRFLGRHGRNNAEFDSLSSERNPVTKSVYRIDDWIFVETADSILMNHIADNDTRLPVDVWGTIKPFVTGGRHVG